jgi:hypothetical protein
LTFIDEIKASGAMKDVYFSPDKRYVVAFFRKKNDDHKRTLSRLLQVNTVSVFLINRRGDYWRSLILLANGNRRASRKIGVVVPFYASFLF